MPEMRILLIGLAFGESPRWHDERLWVADWGTQEILTVDLEGKREVIVKVSFPSFPIRSRQFQHATHQEILVEPPGNLCIKDGHCTAAIARACRCLLVALAQSCHGGDR
jgi:sugar lactone lactonase YvrE